MRTETREVKTVVEFYIADDGKEFTDEDECKAYEFDLLEKSLAFYNHKFEKSTLDGCQYVVLNSLEDINTLLMLCDYQGISIRGLTSRPGIYMYAGYSKDEWVNISEIVDRLRRSENETWA